MTIYYVIFNLEVIFITINCCDALFIIIILFSAAANCRVEFRRLAYLLEIARVVEDLEEEVEAALLVLVEDKVRASDARRVAFARERDEVPLGEEPAELVRDGS